MMQQKADDVEVGLGNPDDAKWAEIGGAEERVQIPRGFHGRQDDPSVARAVQGSRLVTEPGRGGRCAGLGPFKYKTANDGRVAVFTRGREREIRGIGCDQLATTPVLEKKCSGRIGHIAKLVGIDAYGIRALESADSVSIDPHKLGYVPYPAGAFLLKDRRGRELVATDPPYLALTTSRENGDAPVIGRFIFEGSKPGASAAATWLSHKTTPLNSAGHGRIIASTMKAARDLYALLGSSDFSPFRVIRVSQPDLNIVCFLLHHPSLDTLSALNALNETIYRELSPNAEMSAPYMITRTRLTSPAYDGAIRPLLSSLGKDGESYQKDIAEGLTVLRA